MLLENINSSKELLGDEITNVNQNISKYESEIKNLPKEQQELFKKWVQTDLQQRIDRLKTTAMMKARERMGPVELVNWWATFQKNVLKKDKFEDLDEKIQTQILEWEAYPYEIIGG